MLRKLLALVLVALLALPVRAEEPELAPLPTAPRSSLKPPPWLRKNKQGTLVVKSGTKGAVVQIDGLEVGVVPLQELTLPPGKHEVRLTRPGYRERSERVTVRAGKKTSVSLTLKASPGGPAPRLPPLPAEGAPPAPAKVAEVAPVKNDAAAPLVAPPPPPPPLAEVEPAPPLPALPALPPAEPPPPLVIAESRPALPAPAAEVLLRPTVPAEALAPPPDDKPLTGRWYFWGGAAAALLVVAAGVVYALPARYVEKRDPTAACAGPCVVVNK